MIEKIDRFLILHFRRILRMMDILHLPNKLLYNLYFSYILNRLRDILNCSLREYQKCRKETRVGRKQETVEKKQIWVMWWQGIDRAPNIIKNNINNLINIFGNRVKIIDKNNYCLYTDISKEIISRFNDGNISFTQWSDIVRYNLLKNHGGLWIDSSVIVSKKIRDINLFNQEFISLCSLNQDKRYISLSRWTGWFIGGKKNYELFCFLDCFFQLYYKKHTKTIDYFFADDAVTFFYNHSSLFRKNVESQQKEWDPYLFIRNFNTKNTEELFCLFKTKQPYCIQKLTYKYNFAKLDSNSLAKKIEQGKYEGES